MELDTDQEDDGYCCYHEAILDDHGTCHGTCEHQSLIATSREPIDHDNINPSEFLNSEKK